MLLLLLLSYAATALFFTVKTEHLGQLLLAHTLLAADSPVTVVATGPLTALAWVLDNFPEAPAKIEKVLIMGEFLPHPSVFWRMRTKPGGRVFLFVPGGTARRDREIFVRWWRSISVGGQPRRGYPGGPKTMEHDRFFGGVVARTPATAGTLLTLRSGASGTDPTVAALFYMRNVYNI